jgi:aryl-alcohol dehydrogenase-like predicted oxidoreductase
MLRRDIEKDLLPWCREHQVGVLVYSPLQNGILTGKVSMEREFPKTDLRSWSRFYKPENRKRILALLDELRPMAEERHATLAQLVIHWTIRQPGVTVALVGVRNPEQAEENAGAAAFKVTEAEIHEINELLNALVLEP